MKKLKSFMIVCVAIISFTSCTSDSECESCVTEENGIKKVKLGTNDILFKYWQGSSQSSTDKDSYHLYIKEGYLSDLNIESSNFYNINILQKKNKINAIVVYTDVMYTDNDIIKSSDITGFQIYYEEDMYLKTDVYEYTNNTMKQLKELSSTVNYFSFNDIHDCAKIFVSDKKSIFIYFNNEMKTKTKKDISNFKSNLSTFKNKLSSISKDDVPVLIDVSGEKKCKPPCSNLRGAVECTRVNDSPDPITIFA